MIGKNCRILQGQDRHQDGLKIIRNALKNQESCTVVLRNYRKNGTLFWNRVTLSPIHDDRGILTHYLGIQNNITEIKIAEERLLEKVKREELFSMITQRIRESLDLQEILRTTVQEVKQLLLSDRVLVYRILPNHTGQVIAEAVNPGWTFTLDKKFPEETFPTECYDEYIAGKIYAISNVDQMDIRPCLVEFLRQFQVKSKIVVPIIQNQLLWGLLIVHQCDQTRNWKTEEIELLKQIASQLAIAIQQSEYYQQLQRELKERIVAERALLMSQQRIQYLLSSSPGILYSFRAHNTFELTFVSDNAYDLIGYELLEMFENHFWWNHVHPEDKVKISKFGLQTLFEQGSYSHEYRFLHKNGSYIWIYDQLNLVRDEQGNPLEIIGYWIDITDRKQIEEKLQETTSRLTSLISNLQLGVLVKDEYNKVALVNQSFCEIFKIKNCSQRLIGKEWGNIGEEFSTLFDNPIKISQQHQEILANKKIVTNQEIRLADGRILEQNYVPIFIDSIDRGHLWMYRDISDRKQAESRLVTSLQEKEVLLKEIHHRVKNNLLVVSNLLEFQADYVSDPSLIKVLEDSRNRIYSMALIHEKLYRSMTLDTINFGEYLDDLVQNLFESYNLEENRVTFDLDIEPVLLNIETAHPCGLIVNELLSNTLKHAFPEGRQGNVKIIMHQQDDDQIMVKVADNGIGFPENLDFRQVDSLGMELVCTLTEQLEGEITLLRDHGTTFELRFSELNYRQRV
jgi:PAS domain S-box-containing protein